MDYKISDLYSLFLNLWNSYRFFLEFSTAYFFFLAQFIFFQFHRPEGLLGPTWTTSLFSAPMAACEPRGGMEVWRADGISMHAVQHQWTITQHVGKAACRPREFVRATMSWPCTRQAGRLIPANRELWCGVHGRQLNFLRNLNQLLASCNSTTSHYLLQQFQCVFVSFRDELIMLASCLTCKYHGGHGVQATIVIRED